MSIHQRRYSIMFVDDERWALLGIADIIDWSYYNFTIVAQEDNPHRALTTITELKPDAVFVDIRMPGMSGIELMREARKVSPDTEIVIVSAYSDFDAAREAITLGAIRYLLKPLVVEEVREVAQALMKQCEAKLRLPDPHDEAEWRQALENGALAATARSSKCALYIGDQPFPLQLDSVAVIPIHAHGYRYAHILSIADASEKAIEHTLTDMAAQKGSRFGISPYRPNCSCPVAMYKEAEYSYIFRIRFAQYEPVAASQFYICEHYGETITNRMLAERLHLSETYLCERFHHYAGETISSFLVNVRMRAAADMLRQPERSLTEIACAVGYDYSHFGKKFKAYFGMTPYQYRHDRSREEK